MLNEISELFKGMDWLTLIIGAILGAIVSALGKWFFSLFKKREDKFHLSLIQGASSNYSSKLDGDVQVRLQYKGEDYNGELSILEIGLENDGLNAISFPNHFDKPILIRSNAYRIIDVQDISEKKIKAEVTLVGDTVQVSWGLLKKGEKLVFRIVGEFVRNEDSNTEERSTLYDSLSFSVRSDCVDYIKPRRIPFKYLALILLIVSALTGVIHYLSLDNKDYTEEVYSFIYNGKPISGCLSFDEDTRAYIISSPDSVIQSRHLFDFNRYPKITIINTRNQITTIFIIHTCACLFLLLLFGIIYTLEKKQDDRKVFEE